VVISKQILVFLGRVIKWLYKSKRRPPNVRNEITNTPWSHLRFSFMISDHEDGVVVIGKVYCNLRELTCGSRVNEPDNCNNIYSPYYKCH
jgi:hypothetical protein